MTAPKLLLYWLFYINKHSQNVADKKPVIWLLSNRSVLAAFSFYGRVNIGCSYYFFVAKPIQQEGGLFHFRTFIQLCNSNFLLNLVHFSLYIRGM